jgi:hypothetical protein
VNESEAPVVDQQEEEEEEENEELGDNIKVCLFCFIYLLIHFLSLITIGFVVVLLTARFTKRCWI